MSECVTVLDREMSPCDADEKWSELVLFQWQDGLLEPSNCGSDGELIEVPLLGYVAAGSPIEAIENRSMKVRIPRGSFKEAPTYLLKVRGDSMEEAGIYDGDLIAIKKTDQARAGQFVVARVHNEVTLKELRVEKGKPVLVPHNSRYQPMFVAAEDLVIEGLFVGLLRDQQLH